MRSAAEIAEALALASEGLNNCEIGRRTGIPRGTIRDWRRGAIPHRQRHALGLGGPHEAACERCGANAHDPARLPHESYAYLLGMYLGEGFLARQRRGVYRLRIVLDDRYPGIIAECAKAMKQVLPTNSVLVLQRHDGACSEVGASSKQWPCLFPQHAPGRKHERPIRLEPWQEEIVRMHPGRLLRGLIHSDGCRFANTVRHGEKAYSYPRYNFTNASLDIRRIFCDACDRLGVEWRQMNARNISVARRASVALLDQHVGPKA